jgi:uncharacterized protein YukE
MATVTSQESSDMSNLLASLDNTQSEVANAGAAVQNLQEQLSTWTGSSATQYKNAMDNWIALNKQISNAIEEIQQKLGAASNILTESNVTNTTTASTLNTDVASVLKGN